MEELVQYFSQWGPVNAVVVAHNDSALIHTAMDRGQKQEERDIAVAAAAKEVAEEHDSTAALDQVGPHQGKLSHPCCCHASAVAQGGLLRHAPAPASLQTPSQGPKPRPGVLDHRSCTCKRIAKAWATCNS